MLHSKSFKTAVAVFLTSISLSLATVSAAAAEPIISTDYIPITQNNFVADTLNGVDALYNLSGPIYYCSELITRYYKEVYDLSISIGNSGVRVYGNSELYFVKTDSPKEGDILFASASARGKGYNHWALVKDVEVGQSITCFEQNWGWNGQAGINRKIPYTDNCYVAYTMVSKSGNLPVAKGDTGYSTASEWALPYLKEAVDAGYIPTELDFQAAITRSQFCDIAVAIAKAQGLEATGDTAMETAMDLGLITSADDYAITREEMAVIVSRLDGLCNILTQCTVSLDEIYTDYDKIALWAVDPVSLLTGNGLVSPTDGAFLPQTTVTYEQAIRLLLTATTPIALDVSSAEEEPVLCSTAQIVQMASPMLQLAR